MKPATRRALRLSIKKWEKIVAGTGVDEGGFNCALCNRFKTRLTLIGWKRMADKTDAPATTNP